MGDIELEIPAPNELEKCWKINEVVNIFDNTKEIFSLDLKCSILQFFVRFVQLLLIELKIFVKYGWIYIWRSSNLEKKEIFKEIVCLDVSKACQDTDTDVPTKIIRENADIFTNFVRPSTNASINNSDFPSFQKLAKVIPVFKRNSKNSKDNYRTISIFKNISKVYERRLRLTKGKSFRVLLTNLSKAFDCLPQELLVGKLHSYGFSLNALRLIHSHLSNRRQRTKVNESYSSWEEILFGIPQGSILRPLLFNIFMCDLFFIVNKIDFASHADDNTPFVSGNRLDDVLDYLKNASLNFLTGFLTIKWRKILISVIYVRLLLSP